MQLMTAQRLHQLACKPSCAFPRVRCRNVLCQASKTTRGTSQPDSTISPSSSTSSRSGSPEAPRKGLQEHARDMQQRLDGFVHFLTPKQEGDAGDMLMIGVSMVVFIWLAMQMYRMYYYVYLQLGVMDMMQ